MIIALGYSDIIFYVEVKLPNGSIGQLPSYGLHQQQCYDAVYCTAFHDSHRARVVTPDYVIEMEEARMDFRRERIVPRHDPLCCTGYDVYSVFTVYKGFYLKLQSNI